MAEIEDYVGRLTPYWRGKPKFAAELVALVEPMVDLQALLGELPEDFDLDLAIGVQLDAVGIWVGRSRDIPIPIPNIWFSFDDDKRGFDLGVWKGPYDSDTGIAVLDDETYRTFLRAKIAANNWDGTVEGAASAYSLIFPQPPTSQVDLVGTFDEGDFVLQGMRDDGSYVTLTGSAGSFGSLLFITDNGDMTMTVGIAGIIPSLLFLALLEQGFLPLKPEGVRGNYQITSVNSAPLFGFDVQNQYISGFDAGAWGVPPQYFTS
jgi:hypothetical protein